MINFNDICHHQTNFQLQQQKDKLNTYYDFEILKHNLYAIGNVLIGSLYLIPCLLAGLGVVAAFSVDFGLGYFSAAFILLPVMITSFAFAVETIKKGFLNADQQIKELSVERNEKLLTLEYGHEMSVRKKY